MSRADDFARHGTNTVEVVKLPLNLKPGVASKLLGLPRFRNLAIVDCIKRARIITKNRIPCKDKAVAIALILGAEGKVV